MIFWYSLLGIYVFGMGLIFLYSIAQGHLLFHFFKSRHNISSIPKLDTFDLPKVTIQLPLFNERFVAERLIGAVSSMRYPRELLQIQILDDSTDETSEMVQSKIKEFPEINFLYLHRMDRKGFKAGALKTGLEKATGEFIAIFDADFLPDRDFLLKTVPFFASPEVGMVQTRWTHLNQNYSLLTRLQAFALDAHFLIEQIGRNTQGAFINFNGTGGIWRKACILDAGNWHDDMLTEDLDLSYRAQRKGWKFLYRPEIQSPAELPPIMSAIKSQQFRWTKGGAECAVKHARLVLGEKLPLLVKFHAMAHLFNSTIFILTLLVSLSSIGVWWAAYLGLISVDMMCISGIFLVGFFIIALVYLTSYIYTKDGFWRNLLEGVFLLPIFLSISMGLAVHNSQAVIEGLIGKKSPFIRTPKFNLAKGEILMNNPYLRLMIPVTTWIESFLALVFSVMVYLSWLEEVYFLLPFHLMLAVGYTSVFISSFRSYSLVKS